ncbi:hypothetical protein EDD11_003056 [Mortierella claussenii]|nr:hypothetical protein EDD11_003056 [Mortierella claussenii]
MSAAKEKLQEKFALVQQMKREKELKEAKAKESQPFDIFTLAGVNIPSASGAGVGAGAGGYSTGTRLDAHHANGRRLRLETSTSSNQGAVNSTIRPPSQSSSVTSPDRPHQDTGNIPTAEKKLKRSSMAVRNVAQTQSQENRTTVTSPVTGRGRQLSIGSVTSSTSTPSHPYAESPITATPPTPIPSPRNESSTKQDLADSSQSHPVQRARDMTHNVHSRAGSVDENEEMVLDAYGRSIPRSRHQSSDEGSDYGHGSTPYYADARGGGSYDRPQRHYGNYGYHSEGQSTLSLETDPYMAASRYLDIAFYPTKIYVGNLPASASLTTLRTAFRPFGDIEDMNIVEGKDFGFVTYKEPEAAQKALEKMNGTTLDGTEIRVNRAKIPERNRHGFAGVTWMDEDGELARMEEEQHKQAVAIAKSSLAPGLSTPGSSSRSGPAHTPMLSPTSSSSSLVSPDRGPSRVVHHLPPRPRSPRLPPKPTTSFPPVGTNPHAAIAARGGGRQILKYDDL